MSTAESTSSVSPTPLHSLRRAIGSAIAQFVQEYSPRINLAKLDAKLFRDPIFGFHRIRDYEVLIIDSPLFQRLRAITQTSVAFFTYPSSTHSRFEHSLNCLRLADSVLTALTHNQALVINDSHWAEVRLAALLHDVGHCIFSHGSEFWYRQWDTIKAALNCSEVSSGRKNEGELINYCILTSDEFRLHVWEPILSRFPAGHVVHTIKLLHVAQMIIGALPDGDHARGYQTDIINGPLDVDKLDYMPRDGYYTGVVQSIDIDRLLPSLRVEIDHGIHRLVVDYRGLAVVEQLVFARMILYDTVYHHHKVRAANAQLQTIFSKHGDNPTWTRANGGLDSIQNLLLLDEHDFFGAVSSDQNHAIDIYALRYRNLLQRALVIAPRTLADNSSYAIWFSRYHEYSNRQDPVDFEKGKTYFDTIRDTALQYAIDAGADGLTADSICIDIPDPPGFNRLGTETLIKIADGNIVQLEDLFPFGKVVNNYSKQYKYRTYVFTSTKHIEEVAYGVMRAFKDTGILLNDLSLILARNLTTKVQTLMAQNGVSYLKWQTNSYRA